MKKIILALLALLLLSSVNATRILTVDCDGPGWWNTDICRDHELQDEFDQVGDYVDNMDRQMAAKSWWDDKYFDDLSEYRDEEILAEIDANRDRWGKDEKGDGWDKPQVIKYLYNEFVSFLKTLFVTRDEFEAEQDRHDMTRALALGYTGDEARYKAAMIKADRIGDYVYLDGYKCSAVSCIEINGGE
jgi:hypothetical protein